MAGKAPSRLKSEKAHLSKPYEKPKSILKKVATTVKELLLPSWLTSSAWNISPEHEESEQDNGRYVPDAEGFAPHEENALEEASAVAPEVPTFSRRDHEAQFEPSRDGFDCSFVPREVSVRIPSASTPVHPSARGTDGPALMNGDNHSENSEGSGSTSGCSSLVPSLRQRDTASTSATCTMSGLTLSEAALERLRQDLSSRRDFGVTADLPRHSSSARDTGQDKLWSEGADAETPVRQPQMTASGSRGPSFTLSAFSTPATNAAKRKAESPYRSLFYEGRTTYGGASAYRRFNLVNTSGPYGSQLQPEESSLSTVQAQKRPRKDDDFLCMSSTTQRILQSLEKASTPLSEAKKVPLNRGSRDPILSYVSLSQRRRLAQREMSATPPVRGPPNTSLSRPIPIRIQKNLDSVLAERSSAASEATTSASPTVSSAVEVAKEVVPVSYSTDSSAQEETGRGGGKMRAQVVQHQRPSARHGRSECGGEVVQVPDLPRVALPITTLPSFNFRPPPPSSVSSSSSSSTTPARIAPSSAPSPAPPSKKRESEDSEFQFSSPVYQEGKGAPANTNDTSVEFNFSKPVVMGEGKTFGDSPTANSFVPPTPTTAKRKAPSTTESPKGDDAGGFRPASQLILGGSVMDILGKSSSAKKSEGSEAVKAATTAPASGPSEKLKALESRSVSMTPASAPSTKLESVAATASSTPATITTSGFGSRFKPAASSWECDTCLVRNKADATKCVACETPKPGAGPAAKPFATATPATGFGDKFKPPTNSWECSVCMVRNKADDAKCVACESPKPGAAPAPAALAQGKDKPAFKFGIPSDSTTSPTTTGFKFGVPPSTTVPASPSTGFKLAFAAAPEKSAPAAFKFGVPSASNASAAPADTATGFKFGVPDTSRPSSIASAASPKTSDTTDSAVAKIDTRLCTSDSALAKGGLASFGTTPAAPAFKFVAPDSSRKEQKDGTEESPVKKAAGAFSFGAAAAAAAAKSSPFSFNPQKAEHPVAGGFALGIPAKTDAAGVEATVSAATPGKSSVSGGFTFGTQTEKAATVATPSVAQKSEGASEKGLFSFGAPSSKPSEGGVTAGFTFGSAAKKADDKRENAFSFGKTEPTAEKSGFSFGTPAAAKNEGSTAEKGGFSFNTTPLSSTAAPAAEAAKGGFSFNAGAKKDDASKGGFVFGSTVAPSTKQTFAFGAQQASEPAAAAAAVATGGPKFVFGQKTDVSPGTFTFGAASAPAAATTASGSAPTFSFKAAVPAAAAAPSQPAAFGSKTDAPSTAPFAFGGTPTMAPSPAAPAVFSFGAPKSDPAPAAPQPAAPVFSFGASTPSQAPAAAAAAPPSAQPVFSFGASQAASAATTPQLFKFGASSSTPAPTPFGSATPTAQAGAIAPPAANTGFNFPAAASPFGASQSQAAATASPFGASQPQAAAATQFGAAQAAQGQAAPGLFGASAGQAAGASTAGFSFRPPAPAAAPAFQFGSAAPSNQEVFRFGAQAQSQEAQPQQPGTFNFNPPVAGAAPVFGQQMAPAFNFNAAAAVPPAAAPAGFQFPANADNPFSATGSGAMAGRKIRKAVRRKPTTQR
ncbi:nuclear pore complex protein Nup153-like [Ornithodoros turicata]|uniref:nuclear pore complex protein Nup153-like n=1 Tax=Ornithodoros turicata TaxID=34597 RepID=UPI003139ABCA